MNILFICTSNKDRSPALEKYFTANYKKHKFQSAGINKYFCGLNETKFLTIEALEKADLVVFCEKIHLLTTRHNFKGFNYNEIGTIRKKDEMPVKIYKILNLGQFNEDSILVADLKLHEYLV